jgi:hypothetical protein
MSPVWQEEDGTWWYTLCGGNFGPYASKELADDGYEMHVATLSGGCPTCED